MNNILTLVKKDILSILNLRRLMEEQSLFKVLFIFFFAAGMLGGLWMLFLEGFRFLDSLGGFGMILISKLFTLFFLGLALMLAFSSVITSYTTFFGSDETAFLLLKPLSLGEITVYKLLQSAFYASWAFFFTIIPFVGAYAWHERLPSWFSLWAVFFSIPLVLLCAAVGAAVCLLVVRWAPRSRKLWLTVAALLVPALWWISRLVSTSLRPGEETTVVLARLIPGMQIASNPLWPSWWVAEGIMSFTRGQWGRGLMLWSVLVSTTLLACMLVEWFGGHLYYDAWQRTRYAAVRTQRKRTLFGFTEPLLQWVAPDIRALIFKDIRIFIRDPAQWSQGLIFFGLLGLYFLNLRNLKYHTLPAEWRNLITFLNVFSVSAVLCSFGSRFVFPQLSLEGRGFWIVGMAPTHMRRVLLAKFLVALGGMTIVSVALMWLSTRMLEVAPATKLIALGVSVAMALGISGMSTGLGAVFLDLRQTNPAAIVSSFGGTLNLVLSLIFMFVVIVPFGMLFHFRYTGYLSVIQLKQDLVWTILLVIIATLSVTLIPLLIGARSLSRREY